MLASAQITIRDEADWHIADRPPDTPAMDALWLDTSVTPNQLRRWNGVEWVACGSETDLSQYYTKTELDTRFEQTGGSITAMSNRVTTVQNSLGSLNVGGRNYLLGSQVEVRIDNADEFVSAVAQPQVLLAPDAFSHCLGTTLVASFYYRGSEFSKDTSGYAGFTIRWKNANGIFTSGCRFTPVGINTVAVWRRYFTTLALPANITELLDVDFGIYNMKGQLSIRNPQLEIGNRVTAYSPAPEESHIEQSLIPPEEPWEGMLWLDMSVSPSVLKRWSGEEWQAVNDTSALSARIQQAELKITPEAITSAVRETGLYQYDAYEGRNYLRRSDAMITFTNGNYVQNGEETANRYVRMILTPDLFEHSINGSSIYLSLDIKRTNVVLDGNNNTKAYVGFWFYYNATNSDGEATVGNLGWYRRTTDSSFASTDEEWVRMKLGPLNLTNYNATSLRDFQIGINTSCEITGTVQIRNILVEAKSQTGMWSPAPEDADSVADRLALAESFIRQNASSIALKVSQADFERRLEEASLSISPEQIISAVRSSTGLYHYEAYAGRNYALDSARVLTYVDGVLLNDDGTSSGGRFATVKISPDFFENSEGGAKFRLSYDVKYNNLTPANGHLFACWVYYRKNNSSGTEVTQGLGWYLTGTTVVTRDWQRVVFGPLDFTSYGATGIVHILLGLNPNDAVTGTTQIRNVKVEYGNAFTAWEIAPEDPDSVAIRLQRAESNITQNASQISTKVSQNGIISAINQSAEAVSILASKINFNGLVTANQYFKINTDGSMSCTNGTFSGTLNGAKGTFAGALSAATGTFAGMLSAATGTFAGTLTAGNWTFNSNGSVYSNGSYAVYMNVSGGVANFYTQNLSAVYGSTSYNDTTIYGGAVTLNCASTGQSVSARNGYWGSYSYTDVCLVCDQGGNSYASAAGNLGTRDNRWDILWVDTVHYNSRASDSSREIKHDIHLLPAMGDKLDQLVPVSFVYNDDRRNWKRYGLIYEDTVHIMPEICHEIREGESVSRGISYEDLIAVLVKEVQELRARVDVLEQKQ